jgi:hypothetical protein
MHPMRYFENAGLTIPDLPKPLKHTKTFITGIMGELETRILIEQYAGADLAKQLGPKLKGAAYRIDESKPDHRLMLIYSSEWSDEEAASRYLETYRRVLRGKWKSFRIADETGDTFSGKSDDGYFMVTREGKRVLSEEGFAQAFAPSPEPARVDNVSRDRALRALSHEESRFPRELFGLFPVPQFAFDFGVRSEKLARE